MANRYWRKHGFNIAGCLLAVSGLVGVLAGNIPIGMIHVAIGMMFIVLGAAAAGELGRYTT